MSIQKCDRCAAQYKFLHCKLICHNCGARLDCSDLFIDWERVQKTRQDKEKKQREQP
ncbi:MAG: hypothetical protein L0154_23770 [Chloroflexi bacterium]|nr:hypothetical protein [Chloroflexota bacterium]